MGAGERWATARAAQLLFERRIQFDGCMAAASENAYTRCPTDRSNRAMALSRGSDARGGGAG